jgi:hypothetical protein
VRRSAILVATLITPLSAQAAEVMFDGHYRARAQVFNTLSLDRTLSASEGMSSSIEHRVWLRPTFALNDQVTTFIDIRALDGVVWGQETGTQPSYLFRDSLTAPLPSDDGGNTDITAWRAWGQVQAGNSRFEFGRMPLHWASGIWRNDGTTTQEMMANHGDSADRIAWELLVEEEFFVGLAMDVKGQTLLNEKDEEIGYSGHLVFRNESTEAGFVSEYRHTASPAPNERFNLFTIDMTAGSEMGNLDVRLEAVGQFGGGFLPEIGDGVSVTAFGALLELGLTTDPWQFGLDLGMATGDEDPNDLRLKTFTFDRDYSVGLFLFEQPMPRLAATVASVNGGRDDSYVATGDALANAVFLKPQLSRQLGNGWTVDASTLFAWAAKLPESMGDQRSYGIEFGGGMTYTGIDHLELNARISALNPGTHFSNLPNDLDASFDEMAVGAQLGGLVRF